MTTNYKETNISGTQWQRACRVIINNPYRGVPSIIYCEEAVTIDASGNTTATPVAEVSCTFDPNNKSHVSIYRALNALYMQLAEERDAKEAQVYEEPPKPAEGEATNVIYDPRP
uniref:Uncharacterized protein n=1 Tax=Geobacter metallireducens TaxID=28232 RepID=A0A831U083_GEOME